MNWIFIIFTAVFFALQQAECSGVFELRLKSFDNMNGKYDSGKCCSGSAVDGECRGSCRTRFRVCLKHYQAQIDDSPCTFGDVVTPVLGGNSVNMLDSRQEGFVNPIQFPFDFTWPRWFTLIVEALHDTNETSRNGVLITRLSTQRLLDIGDQWTEDEKRTGQSIMRYEYRVTCDEHYYGTGCEKLCRPRDDNFGHYDCSPTGNRVCLPGWQGDYCTKPRCLPGCDEQHGTCEKPNECKCHGGWEGPLCNQCQRYPGCMHGTCVKPWDCLCDEGWGGLFCNQDLNYCTNHKPCRNGGTCFNTGQGSYTCSCPPGFNGTDCEQKVDTCAHDSCQNGGTCVNNGTYQRCECPKGWHGIRCEKYVETCEDKPCRNGGTCAATTSSPTGYRCSCPAGFTGSECELQLNPCSPNPCKNSGSCVEHPNGGGFQCTCPTGFTGSQCEINIDDCAINGNGNSNGNPCQNGGTCIDQVNAFRCQCVPGFAGPLCQEAVDYCLMKPCANGGICQRLTNSYRCVCRAGFTGPDCSEEVNECESQPCLNGGTCRNHVNHFECVCSAEFTGITCNKRVSVGDVSAQVSPDSGLSTEHVVVIATLSTFVPLLVLIAAVVVMCLKQRRKREQARADEEARMQNEQNTVHSSMAKRATNTIGPETHVIKNSWGKCTNNVLSSSVGVSGSISVGGDDVSVSDSEQCFTKAHHQLPLSQHQHQHQQQVPVYTLQRTRSHKQLNTETAAHRASALLSGKLHDAEFDNLCPSARLSSIDGATTIQAQAQLQSQPQQPQSQVNHNQKRISVLSNASSLCNTSDPSLMKRPLDKDGVSAVLSAAAAAAAAAAATAASASTPTNGVGVYVIEEHFHRPEALHPHPHTHSHLTHPVHPSHPAMFATEV